MNGALWWLLVLVGIFCVIVVAVIERKKGDE
jgi:hypothetical protein